MSAPVLVCFAVRQEAKPFQKLARGRPDVRVLLTGMGSRNAEAAIRAALKDIRPSRVFTCGFAGALNPDLKLGDVVCPGESAEAFAPHGAKSVSFVCAGHVAVTVAEKTALRAATGADAVEMESGIIHQVCSEAGIQCVTLRVISDPATEDLPLDFNALMTPEQTLSSTKLAWALMRAPKKILALMRLGRDCAFAASRLAAILIEVV